MIQLVCIHVSVTRIGQESARAMYIQRSIARELGRAFLGSQRTSCEFLLSRALPTCSRGVGIGSDKTN
jgi:hypothetical protein